VKDKNWKNIAIELSKSLDRVVLSCDNLDHKRGKFHGDGEACPVCAKIEAAMKKFEEALKNE
jgi:hypothetical protein